MTKDELSLKIKEINLTAEKEKNKAYAEYAYSNNPYKIGDIISDHVNTIRIEKMKPGFASYQYSEMIFHGTLIQKNGKDFKNNKQGIIYQSNIIGVPK